MIETMEMATEINGKYRINQFAGVFQWACYHLIDTPSIQFSNSICMDAFTWIAVSGRTKLEYMNIHSNISGIKVWKKWRRIVAPYD